MANQMVKEVSEKYIAKQLQQLSNNIPKILFKSMENDRNHYGPQT